MSHVRPLYSNAPLDFMDSCCAEHADMQPSDYAVAGASFTIDEHQHDEDTIPTQKFALVLCVDRATVERGGVTITPKITMELLDQWAELIQGIVGPRGMAEAMVHAMIRKYGAVVLEDASVEKVAELVARPQSVMEDGPTPANPIVGGRRRGDYRH